MKNQTFRLIVIAVAMLLCAIFIFSCGTRQKEASSKTEKFRQENIDKTLKDMVEEKYGMYNSRKRDSYIVELKKDKVDTSTTISTTTYFDDRGNIKKQTTSNKKRIKSDKSQKISSAKSDQEDASKTSENIQDHSKVNVQNINQQESKDSNVSISRSNTLYQNIGGWKTILIVSLVLAGVFLIYRRFK